MPCQAVDDLEICAGDLDSNRALDSGGEHVDTVAYRRNPDVSKTRDLYDLVELLDKLLRGHAGSPFAARLELNGRLKHLKRCGVGCGLGAADLAEHACHLGHSLDQAIGLLQQLRDLAG